LTVAGQCTGHFARVVGALADREAVARR